MWNPHITKTGANYRGFFHSLALLSQVRNRLTTKPLYYNQSLSNLIDKWGQELREAIKNGVLPLEKIVLQSNAPFMLPNVPDSTIDPVSAMLLEYCYMGQNEPCALSTTVRTIAKQLEKEPRDVAAALNKTATGIFNFPHVC